MKLFKVLSFTLVLLFITSCSEQKDFNSTKWKNWTESENRPGLRWQMHKDLLKKYDLEDYNKEQVLNLLGKPNSETNGEYHYPLGYTERGINTGTMIITFENDHVVDIKIING